VERIARIAVWSILGLVTLSSIVGGALLGTSFVGSLLFPVLWITCAIVGDLVGTARGRPTAGFFLGFCLGPLGWVLALFLPPPYAAPAQQGPPLRDYLVAKAQLDHRVHKAVGLSAEEAEKYQAAKARMEAAGRSPGPPKPVQQQDRLADGTDPLDHLGGPPRLR